MLLCMPLAYSTQRTDEALQQGRNRYPWLVVLWYDVIRVILSDGHAYLDSMTSMLVLPALVLHHAYRWSF